MFLYWGPSLCAVWAGPQLALIPGYAGLGCCARVTPTLPLHAQGPQMPMALYTCPTRRWSPLLEAWCSVRRSPAFMEILADKAGIMQDTWHKVGPLRHVWCHCGCG